MILNIIIGIVIYVLLLALICLFLKGATKNEREFEEQQEYQRMKKLLDEDNDREDEEVIEAEVVDENNIRSEFKDNRKKEKF
jgi:FtsZ-interacting cell division protein ZipA